MSTLINASIKTSELKKIDKNKIIHGEKDSYINITISVNDESRYGKNVSITIAQDQDERARKAPKHYLGNGSVIWTDGKVVKGQKEDQNNGSSEPFETVPNNAVSNDDMNDLPF
jgi:hypothetical protein